MNFTISTEQGVLPGGVFTRPILILALFLVALSWLSASASAETRSLKLYYLHTGEKATIAYKKNGRYLPAGLKKINWALRDWRRNEPTKMDPNLLDLVWEAYRRSGSKDYIHVISGYRSPATNSMLKKRGRGVAKKSQHTLGRALDFFLPDVKLSKLREIGLKMHVGGVGYYPTSGSPFVHLDVGRVRHWPRMTRKQLARVFPNGKTMHVPTDGKPLKGYKAAVASYESRKKKGSLVPNSGSAKGASGLFARLSRKPSKEEPEADEDTVANKTPAPRAVRTVKAAKTIEAPKSDEIALPSSVPVPVTAPRNDQLNAGAEIVVASLPPERKPETPASVEAAVAVKEPEVPAEDEATGTLIDLANVPVPTQRPEYSAPGSLLALNEDDKEPAETRSPVESSLLALREEPDSTEETRLAALSPREIEDLRRAASPRRPIPQVPVPQALIPQAPTPQVSAPSAAIPVEPVNGEALVAETASSEAAGEAGSLEIAVVEPKDGSATNEISGETASESIPVPVTNPRRALDTAEPVPVVEDIVVAALAPASAPDEAVGETAQTNELPLAEVIPAVSPEPETENTGELSVSEENRNLVQPDEPAIALAETRIANASRIPVPAPNPQRLALPTPDESASEPEDLAPVIALDPEPTETGPATELASLEVPIEESSTVDTGLSGRTVSLDPLSAPQDNTSVIGKWALAHQRTVGIFAPVQAPAYGRNMIRKVPDNVPVTGFAMANASNPYRGFSGKAVRFTKFARLIN